MFILIVLFGSLLFFRGLGALGVPIFRSWKDCARYGLAVMLCFTASAHFTPMRNDLLKMVPPWMPNADATIYVTGALESLGAIGLCIPRLRHITGIALVLLFLAVLPANIHASQIGATIHGKPVMALGLRIPMQLVFIAIAWWSTRKKK